MICGGGSDEPRKQLNPSHTHLAKLTLTQGRKRSLGKRTFRCALPYSAG
jgi:hypothetical protein